MFFYLYIYLYIDFSLSLCISFLSLFFFILSHFITLSSLMSYRIYAAVCLDISCWNIFLNDMGILLTLKA
jgi:hypothetical protein